LEQRVALELAEGDDEQPRRLVAAQLYAVTVLRSGVILSSCDNGGRSTPG